jgi:peptidoglycan hydrolase-like protein with peptidoglycan-binding domain
MVSLSFAGAANALYFQTHRHPAPMFAPPPAAEVVRAPAVAPVRPATRRKPQTISSIVSNDMTGSLPTQPGPGPVGNSEVFAVQQKLAAFRLFAGNPDGYYGPRTANAIRAFEQQSGLKPQGRLTKDVVTAILQASLPAPDPVAQPMPQIAQLQAPEPVPDTQPVQGIAQPAQPQAPVVRMADARLPAAPGPLVIADQQPAPMPAPLAQAQPQAAVQPQPRPQARTAAQPATDGKPQLVGRVPDSTVADQVFNAAANTAAGAFDAVSSMVADVAGTRGTSTRMQNRLPARSVPQPVNPPPAFASVNANAVPAEAAPAVTASISALPAAPAAVATQPVVAAPAVPAPAVATPANQNTFAPDTSPTDVALVTKVQRGLSSLGFLAGTIDGVAGDSTAKAIRNFEVYYNYRETGRVSPQLLTLLQQAGAVI